MADDYLKEQLLQIAEKWRFLAAHEEKHRAKAVSVGLLHSQDCKNITVRGFRFPFHC